ncbi:MSMEG_6728 family protein [Allorhizocola rhizosphaerae]|uniref:MSMEG_6728 family protein n=1 Tax=Allorhizocola rhizosphaerae TaxID=1872709 RepID=UPI000E3C97D3|nr:MSMEG_6728 family protein [Allorhizocola rhizosphaerae]
MQTFLPYAEFAATAAVLDRVRLGKQRVEALQILRAMTIPLYGWRHHPVVKMWIGYQEALVCYGLTICARWSAMGAADTVAATLRAEFARSVRGQSELAELGELPQWLGWADLHLSHQSSLLRKNPAYYRPIFGPDVPDNLPYVWPLSDRALKRSI